MISLGKNITIRESIETAKEIQVEVNKEFKPPIFIEFEKVMCPLILKDKKKYAALYWTNWEKPSKINVMGLESKRRDACKLLQNTQNDVFKKIFIMDQSDKTTDEERWDNAVTVVQDAVKKLYNNDFDIGELIITKGYSKPKEQYKTKQVHIELARRMAKRNPSTAPRVGDRIPYVIVERGGKKVQTCDTTEDPIYAMNKKLPISVNYYVKKQLRNPLMRIFKPYILTSKKYKKMIDGSTPEIRDKQADEIAEKLLFGHEVTKHRRHEISESHGIGKYFKAETKCLACGEDSNDAICRICSKDENQVKKTIDKTNEEFQNTDENRKRCWNKCYECQEQDIESAHRCFARDCNNFFPRRKADNTHQKSEKKHNRLVIWERKRKRKRNDDDEVLSNRNYTTNNINGVINHDDDRKCSKKNSYSPNRRKR